MTDANFLNIHKIRDILPHRYPFLLIDKITDYTLGKTLSAVKNVSINEPFFQGHFPDRPIFPGVLILEAMAQASAVLVSFSSDTDTKDSIVYLFAGVDKARFKRPVEPGDQLIIEVEQTNYKSKIWKYATKATVDGKLAASASILFTYKIY